MSIFPALVPSTRTYTPGDLPLQAPTGLSGAVTGFRRGNRRVKQTLSLTFNRLTEADLTLIRSHYDNASGSFDVFYLSSEVWSGYETPPVPLVSDYIWRYVAPPIFEDTFCGRWNITIELETVPIEYNQVIYDGGLAPAAPARTYILDAGAAPAVPARDYVISPIGAA